MKISEKIVFVTGGASGLGEATARWFIERNSSVVIFDLADERGTAIQEEFCDSVLYMHGDVTSEDDMKHAVTMTIETFGRIDVLVACAGVGSGCKVVGRDGPHPLDKFNRVIQIDLVGTFNALRLCAEQMMKNEPTEGGERGVIICVSSIAAWEGQIGQSAYSAAKGGVNGLVLTAARDLASSGIRVMGIAPGFMATPQVMRMPDKYIQGICSTIPFPSRPGKPEEFAHLVNAIIENEFLNGSVIRLDGAIRMQPR